MQRLYGNKVEGNLLGNNDNTPEGKMKGFKFLIVGLSLLLTACNSSSIALTENHVAAMSKEDMIAEASEFDPIQFDTACKENLLRATETYGEHIYQFTGYVESIETDYAVITCKGNFQFHAYLSKEELVELNACEAVTIVGQLDNEIKKEEFDVAGAANLKFTQYVVNVTPAYIMTKDVILTGKVDAVADTTTNTHNCYFYPDFLSGRINLKNATAFQGFDCSYIDEYSFIRADGIMHIDGQEILTNTQITISAKIGEGGNKIEDLKIISIENNTKEEAKQELNEKTNSTQETESLAADETIGLVDEALQGSWVYDTTTITFSDGRFLYDYIRVSDGKRDTPEGNYEIGENTITLAYDSGVSAEMDYTFENGVLNLLGEKGGESYSYIKQE